MAIVTLCTGYASTFTVLWRHLQIIQIRIFFFLTAVDIVISKAHRTAIKLIFIHQSYFCLEFATYSGYFCIFKNKIIFQLYFESKISLHFKNEIDIWFRNKTQLKTWKLNLQGTLMQIWKSPYIFVFI